MRETLFINPPYTDYFESPHFAPSRPSRETATVSVPLGLAYLAGYLREQGVSVECMDLEVEPRSLVDIAGIINEKKIQVVGITTTTPVVDKAIKIGRYLKRETSAMLVLGGVHASAEPIETSELDIFDAVVVGEGEYPMRDLSLLDMEPQDVPGVVAVDQVNERYGLIKNLDDLPLPALDLFPAERYQGSLHRDLAPDYDQPYYTMIAGRGCPYNCRFCYSKGVFLYRVRDRSIQGVLDEIGSVAAERRDRYPNQPVKLMFYDDTFTLKRSRILEFCEGVRSRGLNIIWGCNTRLDRVDPVMLAAMKEAGCKRVYVGIESGNEEILRGMMKGLTIQRVRNGVEMIKEVGIEISASYIIGVPQETHQTIGQTIAFSQQLNTDFAHFYAFTPDPGSPYYVELKARRIIEPHDWEDYSKLVRKATLALGEQITYEEVVTLTRQAYTDYYGRREWAEMRKPRLRSAGEEKQHELILKQYVEG